jgi:hypothetical protein
MHGALTAARKGRDQRRHASASSTEVCYAHRGRWVLPPALPVREQPVHRLNFLPGMIIAIGPIV